MLHGTYKIHTIYKMTISESKLLKASIKDGGQLKQTSITAEKPSSAHTNLPKLSRIIE